MWLFGFSPNALDEPSGAIYTSDMVLPYDFEEAIDTLFGCTYINR